MDILIFGGTGRTGQIIRRMAEKAGHNVMSPTHQECDLRRPEDITRAVLGSGAQAVINAAAMSGLEACLDDPVGAHLVNAVAPAAMALACRHTGARFVHLSTDYVLDGRREGAKPEGAKCHPVNIYGESKREGELQVAESLPGALILRLSWIMGNPAKPSFVEQAIERALRGESLAAIADKWSMPTDAEDIARAILTLLTMQHRGVLHVCSGGPAQSWHSCARTALQAVADAGALPALPPIEEQKLQEAVFFRTPRPKYTVMDNAKLRSLGVPMPEAGECLRRVALRYLEARAADGKA